MECRILLIMRRALLLLLLLFGTVSATTAPQSVVLVVRADSPVNDLDSVTVRKLFLGLPVLINGRPLHPIRNRADEQLDQIFLQEIVAMSQTAYDRQTLTGLNRQGWLRPVEVDSDEAALDKVHADANAITFIWQRDLPTHHMQVRVIRVLWSD
jgi:hypothetical protein